MQRGREGDKAEETQGSKNEDGAVVKQSKKPPGRGDAEKQPRGQGRGTAKKRR